MKKLFSIILAFSIILSVGTVGVSAADFRITVAPTVKHVRQDDIAYYPVKFDVSKINGTYAELCESNGFAVGTTHIELGYSYRSDTLSFIDAIPEEALYNLGGTVKVTEHGTEDSEFNYFFIEIDFSGSEGLANEYFFNLKFEVLQEKFLNSLGISRTLIYNNPIYADYENMIVEELVWEVSDSNGTVHDLSSKIDLSYASFGDGYTSYDQLLIKDYEPFIPPVCDITEVTYIQQEDTHKDFTVTANGRKSMIQFMEPDGGTRTYDRYHKNAKITSYNSDGEVVNSMARDLAYEVWEIYSNMSVGNEIKVRGKENGKWDAEKYSFTIEPYNPIISMELSATSGKKGPVPATVVADDKTEKVMFKMPDNTTVTVASKATDENGNKIFTGKAWMNKDGLNEIRILIYRNNVWRQVGTLEYNVE
ncbi:MAG: hypothetical protein IIX16_00140 [Clostridia bacterium]|nr:hypothetical protein [Clostridia bacterium]